VSRHALGAAGGSALRARRVCRANVCGSSSDVRRRSTAFPTGGNAAGTAGATHRHPYAAPRCPTAASAPSTAQPASAQPAPTPLAASAEPPAASAPAQPAATEPATAAAASATAAAQPAAVTAAAPQTPFAAV
jgi:hypothetical protein